jgi:DNA-binding response OmpR family regulator
VSAVSQAKKENPDVILRDLGLPAGDGYVVMERLGNIESLALVPIIVLTAREEEFHKQLSLQAGAKAFFQKLVDHGVLLTAVDQIVDGPISMQPSAI